MGVICEMEHTTTYNYANPVSFGPHRAMFLPMPAARGRVLIWHAKTKLTSRIRWVNGRRANNVAEIDVTEAGADRALPSGAK